MAATNVKGRLVADPSIGLSDLMGPLRSFAEKLDPNAESNLLDLLAVPKGVTWKTAIHPEWLTHLGKLYEAYARIAPNSIIPPKKHRLAITELSKSQSPKLHSTKKAESDVVDYVDEMIRVGFSQFRRLAQSSEIKTQTFRRCTPLQVESIEAVLSLMRVGKDDWVPMDLVPGMSPEDMSRQPERMPSSGSLGASSAHPSPSPRVAETSCTSPAIPGSAIVPKTMQEAEAIFAAALATEDLDLEQLATPTKKSDGPGFDVGMPSSPMALHRFVAGADEGDDDAEDIFKEAAETIPIGVDGKSQLQIFRQAGGKSKNSNVDKIKGLKKAKAEHSKPEHKEGGEPEVAPAVRLRRKSAFLGLPADFDGDSDGPPGKDVPKAKGKADKKKIGKKDDLKTDAKRGKKDDPKADAKLGKKDDPKADAKRIQKDDPKTDAKRSKKADPKADAKLDKEDDPKADAKLDKKDDPKADASMETKTKGKPSQRTIDRKRVVSRAYHVAYEAALKRNIGEDAAKEEARKAHAEAGKKFDSENPKK